MEILVKSIHLRIESDESDGFGIVLRELLIYKTDENFNRVKLE